VTALVLALDLLVMENVIGHGKPIGGGVLDLTLDLLVMENVMGHGKNHRWRCA
jgi:hypothetical protein